MTDAPPFVLSRESRIRIDRDGRFWHEDAPIEHAGLIRGLASWLAVDPASDRYVLRNAMDWCFITVDDAPLVARAVRVEPDGRFTLQLSDGTDEALDLRTLRVDDDDVAYCDVRGATLPCRLAPTAAYVVLSRAEPAGDGYVLRDGATEVPVRRVPRGQGAPRRAPARPPA